MYIKAIENSKFSLFFTSWEIENGSLILTFKIKNNTNSIFTISSIYLKNNENAILPRTYIPQICNYVVLYKSTKHPMFNNYFSLNNSSQIKGLELLFFAVAFKIKSDDNLTFVIDIKNGKHHEIESFSLDQLLTQNKYKISNLCSEHFNKASNFKKHYN